MNFNADYLINDMNQVEIENGNSQNFGQQYQKRYSFERVRSFRSRINSNTIYYKTNKYLFIYLYTFII